MASHEQKFSSFIFSPSGSHQRRNYPFRPETILLNKVKTSSNHFDWLLKRTCLQELTNEKISNETSSILLQELLVVDIREKV